MYPYTEAYLESSRTSTMEIFEKIQSLTIFAKSFIVDVRLGSNPSAIFTHKRSMLG